MKLLRTSVRGMLSMCPAAWRIFLRCIQLSAFLLFCAWMLLLRCGDYPMDDMPRYINVLSLNELAQVALLMGVILPPCVEDLHGKGR